MITGEVTPDREAVVTIRIRNAQGITKEFRAIIDTGFTDYLTLPEDIIEDLALPFENTIRLYLAGNTEAVFDMHWVTVEWDGEDRETLAYKAEGVPLIGMGLLRGFHLEIDGIDGGRVVVVRI